MIVSFKPVECKRFFMSRPKIITGNWKMYKTIDQSAEFIKSLAPLVESSPVRVFLAVPFTAIQASAAQAKGTKLVIGAQNMNDVSEGAFTGEVAGKMLKNAGATFVLIGHSERRRYFHEDDALVNRKVKRAIADGLQPVLCVGETKDQRKSGQFKEAVQKQLTAGLADLTTKQLKDLIVAYEPTWAVGSGIHATPEEAQEMHHFCRGILTDLYGADFANGVVIQYGGSVNPANAQSLTEQADVDGLLVGGASLSLELFAQIVNNCGSTQEQEIT